MSRDRQCPLWELHPRTLNEADKRQWKNIDEANRRTQQATEDTNVNTDNDRPIATKISIFDGDTTSKGQV
eukprot:444504-Amphidinium_carterae.2